MRFAGLSIKVLCVLAKASNRLKVQFVESRLKQNLPRIRLQAFSDSLYKQVNFLSRGKSNDAGLESCIRPVAEPPSLHQLNFLRKLASRIKTVWLCTEYSEIAPFCVNSFDGPQALLVSVWGNGKPS